MTYPLCRSNDFQIILNDKNKMLATRLTQLMTSLSPRLMTVISIIFMKILAIRMRKIYIWSRFLNYIFDRSNSYIVKILIEGRKVDSFFRCIGTLISSIWQYPGFCSTSPQSLMSITAKRDRWSNLKVR